MRKNVQVSFHFNVLVLMNAITNVLETKFQRKKKSKPPYMDLLLGYVCRIIDIGANIRDGLVIAQLG